MTIRTRPRWWRAIAALTALLLLLAACGNDDSTDDAQDDTTTDDTTDDADTGDDDGDDGDGGDDGEPQYGGRVEIGVEAEAGGYIPALTATGTASPTVDGAIYDALVIINGEGQYEPFLAESVEPNDDLSEWTITLRPDVEFHDGTPLDADAIVWNYENLHRDPESLTAGTLDTAGVESVEAVDELTVVYTLSGPNAAFPDLLYGRIGMPVSPTAFEEMGLDAFGSAPVGTGPFVVDQWVRDDRIELTRNENYWLTDEHGNQLPYLDEVVVRPIPDEDSRINSLLADDAQVIHTTRGYAGKRIVEAADTGPYESNIAQGNIAGSSLFNTISPPLDDVRVRAAMVMATSSEDVAVAQGYDGITTPASQFVGVDSPWHSTTAEEAYPGSDGQDLDAAAELLEEYINDPDRSDGQPVGSRLTVRYQCPPEPSLQDMAVVLQSSWNEIGIDIELVSVDQPTLISNVIGGPDNGFSGDYDMTCWRTGSNNDPLNYLSGFFGPVESSVLNFVNFTDPGIDEALTTLRTSADFEERYEANEEINTIANENVVVAWHISYSSIVGWRDDLNDVSEWSTPEGSPGRGNLAGRIWVHWIWMDQ